MRSVWCVGQNYAEHSREMGVDPGHSTPVFFSKPAQALVNSDRIAYPPNTAELHHEIELVTFLHAGGQNLSPAQARQCIFGYAVGVDLTRRDVQRQAKAAGEPWEMSKGFDQSGPVGLILSAKDWSPDPEVRIDLTVGGKLRQSARLGDMIWSVADLLAKLSQTVTLGPGDVIFTGTPAGVSALKVGHRIRATIEGLPALDFTVVAP